MPLRFEANQGQWNAAVRYAARAGGYTLLLTGSGASLAIPGAGRVDIALAGSNPAPAIQPLSPLPARTDYFMGSRAAGWHTGVGNYGRIRYASVYPSIDMVYYGAQNRLEYDFVLQPGADPKAIRMRFTGPAKLATTADGDLSLDVAGTRLLQKKPVIYQDGPGGRRRIEGRYRLLARDTVGVSVGRYDRGLPLVIDPVLFCTYMGTSATDEITAVKLDAKGRLYVAGWTTTGELSALDGAYKGENAGATDIFVAVLDTTQSNLPPVYLSYLGGTGVDVPLAIDVDSDGVIYLTGTTASTDFPTAGTPFQSTGAASTVDAFVAKIDPSKYGSDSLVASTYLGGTTAGDTGNGIAVGPDGSVYVIGTTRSSDFPLTSSAYAASLYGPQDAFLCKLSPDLSALSYSSYLGGELNDDGRSIVVDKNGLVYFAVVTDGTLFPMPLGAPPYRGTLQGRLDSILGVMDMTKAGVDSLVWDTYFGGSDSDEVRRIAFDKQGNLLVTGYTLSADFPVTPDAMQPQYAGAGDVFVSVVNPLNPAAFIVYSTFLGGKAGEVGYDIASDNTGAISVTGYTLSSDFPVTPDAVQGNWGRGIDVFYTRFKPGVAGSAALQSSTYFGSTGIFVPMGMALAADGTVYLAGYGEIGLPSSATGNGYGGGSSDGFIVVLGSPAQPAEPGQRPDTGGYTLTRPPHWQR